MKTLRQVLADYSEEQLGQLAQSWGIDDMPKEGWRRQFGQLVQRMQDRVAARFVWERLAEDERKLLFNSLSFSAANGVLRSVLVTLSRLPQPRFEAALATLVQHSLVLEEGIAVKSGKSGVADKSAVGTVNRPLQKKLPAQPSSMVQVPKDIADVLLAAGRAIFSSSYDLSTMPLEKILSSHDLNHLYEIGRVYGIVLNDYYSSSSPSSRLVGHLVQPEVASFAWDQLDSETQKLCKWLVDEGGKASMQAIREHTGYDDAHLAKIIHTFERYAIAFDTFSGAERRLFIPHEILKNVKKATLQPETAEDTGPVGLVTLDELPQIIHTGNPLMLYDLAVIIGAMYQQNIEPIKSGDVPKRVSSKLLPMLQTRSRRHYGDTDSFNVDFMFDIAKQLGLVQLSASMGEDLKKHYEPGPELKEWSQMVTADQVRDLVENWLKSHTWSDIAGMNFDPSSTSYYLDMHKARNTVLKYLTQCTPGNWYSMASLLRTIKAEDIFLLRSNQAFQGLVGYRNAKTIRLHWDRCDGEIIIGMLTSTLFELGVVSLGYQSGQAALSALPGQTVGAGLPPVVSKETNKPINPDAFMLTDLAAAILPVLTRLANEAAASTAAQSVQTSGARSARARRKATPVEPPAQDGTSQNNRTLIVQPNFELLLLQPDLQTLYSLLPFAQLNQAGVVSRLTITRSSILRGLETGKNIEQVLQILEEHSQKEIPQNVAYTLRDWARLYKEVTISQVLLLEVDNEALANELCQSPKLKALGLRRLGPCAITIGGNTSLPELRRIFDKDGIVVHISGEITTRRDYRTVTYGRP